MAQLPVVLDKFNCEGEPASLDSSWERWKSALEIYLLVSNIESLVKKRTTLLHIGGLTLQEVYYNIPETDAEEAERVDVYKIAVKKRTDEYFSPKQSKIYERHVFRIMRQEDEQIFENFLLRLRTQAEKYQFKDKGKHLIDQITEKCSSVELRKKIVSRGDNITLNNIV